MISAVLLATAVMAAPSPITPAASPVEAPAAAASHMVLTIETASVVTEEQTAQDVLDIRLDAASRSAFARLTADNVGRQLALLVDGETLTQPVIQSPIEGGEVRITAGVGPHGLSPSSLEAIAARLNAGGRIEVRIVTPDDRSGDLSVGTEAT